MLLENVISLMETQGFRFGNCDITVIAQKPKLAPYILQMRENIAKVIKCNIADVNIKATTEEHLGFTGDGSGVKAYAVALIEKI